MKKILAVLLMAATVFTFAACGEKADVKGEGVMTYAEYEAAELDSEVVVETYVQAKQGWWQDKATLYTQDKDGAYFIYELPCSEEEYEKLVPGTKIKVTGYKAEWSGEVEIVDAKYEILDGSYIAKPKDVTSLFGNEEELLKLQNQLVAWLFAKPQVLILDEPTRGIDVGAKYEIYSLMNKLVEQGMAIIMISSELPEVLGMSDRLYVMSEGHITGELSAEEASEEKVMAMAIKS